MLPPASDEWKTDVGIKGKAGDLLWHGLASSTRKSYSIGQASYVRFVKKHGFHTFPVTFEALAEFIAETAEQTSVETAKAYVSHLRSLHIDHGHNTDIFNDKRIKLVLRGASWTYTSKPIQERMEITKEVLEAMLNNLHSTHDDLNLRAAFCLAFSAFLRIGEFTWSQWNDQSFLLHISRGSVQFVPGGLLLQLPASKTDPFRKGVSIPLSKSSDTTCPVSALRLLL